MGRCQTYETKVILTNSLKNCCSSTCLHHFSHSPKNSEMFESIDFQGLQFQQANLPIIYFENLVEQKRDNFYFAVHIGM
jgi:hypothetical protein